MSKTKEKVSSAVGFAKEIGDMMLLLLLAGLVSLAAGFVVHAVLTILKLAKVLVILPI